MKKVNAYLLLLLVSLTISIPKEVVSASELELDVDAETIEVAKNNWYLYVSAIADKSNLDSYYLSTPFNIENGSDEKVNTSVFPIIEKKSNNVAYTLQVTNDENHSTILETNLADELSKERKSRIQKDVKMEENISDGSDIPEEQVPPYTKKIVNNFSIRERQNREPWCLYFTYASVVNTLENKAFTTARELVKYNFPTATEAQLMDEKYITTQLSYEESLKKLEGKTGYKCTLLSGRLTNQAFKSEIDNNRPFIMDIRNSKAAHAITAIGYIESKDPKLEDFYIAWNPVDYNGGYMMLSSNQLDSISSGAEQLSWMYTVYNFRK